MKDFLKANFWSLSIIVICIFWAIFDWDSIPNHVPTRFDVHGNPDEFKERESFWLALPALNIFLIVMNAFLMRFDENSRKMSSKTLGVLNLGLTILLMSVFMGIILEARTGQIALFSRILFIGIGLFMILLSAFIGKLEKKTGVGIRVPWTLNSEENWRRTHHFSKKVFLSGGVFVIVSGFFNTPNWLPVLTLLAAALVGVFFSLFYFLRFEKVR